MSTSNTLRKEENEKIRQGMISVFTKLSSSHTVAVGNEMLKKIISENEKSEFKLNFILSQISEQINSLKKAEKKESIKLLSTACAAIKEVSLYLSRILTILQSNIVDDNASMFTTISATYGEIVDSSIKSAEMTNNSTDTNGNTNTDNKKVKTVYELLQGFCIYNLKQNLKANQICGSLCLTSLIETCPLILQPSYMKYIWENIIFFIDKPNYNAKSELLNSLISLIFASENIFKPFSTVTLYKILDFLTDTDWFRRKLALNVIYTLIIYCQDEILPLKGHIVEFLRVLKSDKVKEVREVCMQTLKLFNEVVSEGESESESQKKNEKEKEKENRKEISNISNKGKEKEKENFSKDRKDLKDVKNVNELSPIRPEGRNESFIKMNPSSVSSNNNKNRSKTPKVKKESVKKVIPRSNTNNSLKVSGGINMNGNKNTIEADETMNLSGIGLKSVTNSNINITLSRGDKRERAITPVRKRVSNKSKYKSMLNDISQDINENNLDPGNTSKRERVNRKGDNSFVNSKMVIKRDPSYSIFKTGANQEFFSNAPKENGEIQVVYKEKEEKNIEGNKTGKLKEEEENDNDNPNYVNYVKMLPKKSIEMPLQMSTEGINKENNLKTSTSNFMENSKIDLNLKNESFAEQEKEEETESNKMENKDTFDKYKVDNSKIEISDIIKQMRILSEKQIYLIDTIEKIQENTNNKFSQMNNRIQSLEKTVQQLVGIIKSSGIQQNNNNYSTNASLTGNSSKYESNNYNYNNNNNLNMNNNSINKEDFDSFGGNSNSQNKNSKGTNNKVSSTWGEILQELKNKNPSSAFNLAINSEDVNVIKLIDKINVNQIKEVGQNTMEETISHLTKLITKGQYITVIISFFKNLLVTLEYNLRNQTYQNLKDILLYTSSNKLQFNLNNEAMIDINLLLSVLNSKLNKTN